MIKVLIVDDSPAVRRWCERVFATDPELTVVGAAPDPFVARDLIVERGPDVVTLDLEMPRMDGVTFLRRLMHYHPLPVVILSSLTPRGGERALEAMRAGALAVICKPSETVPPEQTATELIAAVKAAAQARVRRPAPAPAPRKPAPLPVLGGKVLAIGASTGGTTAIEALLEQMPPEAPPILIVQHMPPMFTESFAARLDRVSAMRVREARDGDAVLPGVALVAPGGKHMLLRRGSGGFAVQVKEGPQVSGHRPSVDVLFRSVALAAGRGAIGALLTGMGADGAQGLLEMRRAGAMTFAQDADSSVVFGMPKVAIDLGAAARVVSLEGMAAALLSAASR